MYYYMTASKIRFILWRMTYFNVELSIIKKLFFKSEFVWAYMTKRHPCQRERERERQVTTHVCNMKKFLIHITLCVIYYTGNKQHHVVYCVINIFITLGLLQ